MDEIISLVVANGLFAVLFCGLLVYELKDSRRRERGYTQTIRALSERLGVVAEVRSDTTDIRANTDELLADTKRLRSDTDAIKKSVARRPNTASGNANA